LGLGVGLTTFHSKKKKNCYENHKGTMDLDGFFGQTTQATKYGYENWYLERKEFI
jgi:hypothetical protein